MNPHNFLHIRLYLKNSQIISYVEKNYRTNYMKMYFGWEMAGGFALELFANKPKIFNARDLIEINGIESRRAKIRTS